VPKEWHSIMRQIIRQLRCSLTNHKESRRTLQGESSMVAVLRERLGTNEAASLHRHSPSINVRWHSFHAQFSAFRSLKLAFFRQNLSALLHRCYMWQRLFFLLAMMKDVATPAYIVEMPSVLYLLTGHVRRVFPDLYAQFCLKHRRVACRYYW
jgi:hypothetical protein